MEDDYDSKISQLCSLTGLTPEEAGNLYEAAEYNLDLAVQLHFDSRQSPPQDAPGVRPPIAPTKSRIVSDDYYDDYDTDEIRPLNVGPSGRSAIPQPFAENAAQNPQSATAARLAQLYRPPLELIHNPPIWDAARTSAKSQDCFLLVSLFDPTIFACHVANRDLWSHPLVRDFVKSNLVFLQLAVSGNPANPSPGDTYSSRYQVSAPHIGIIDPKTGELVHSFSHHPQTGSISSVEDFLATLSEVIHPDITQNKRVEEHLEEENEEKLEEFPEEEPANNVPNVTTIMFRLKDGTRMPRRFLLSDSLDKVFKVARMLQSSQDKMTTDKITLRLGPQVLDHSPNVSIQDAKLANSLLTIS